MAIEASKVKRYTANLGFVIYEYSKTRWDAVIEFNADLTDAILGALKGDVEAARGGFSSLLLKNQNQDSSIVNHLSRLEILESTGVPENAIVPAVLVDYSFSDVKSCYVSSGEDSNGWELRSNLLHNRQTVPTGVSKGQHTSHAAAASGGGLVADYYFNTTDKFWYELTNVGSGTEAATKIQRAGSENLPLSLAVAVVGSGASTRVILLDMTNEYCSLWADITSTVSISGAFFAASRLYLNTGVSGFLVMDFARETVKQYSTAGIGTLLWPQDWNLDVSSFSVVDSTKTLPSNAINSLESFPYPAGGTDSVTEMPIPLICGATDSGVFELENDGEVLSSNDTAVFSKAVYLGSRLYGLNSGDTPDEVIDFGPAGTLVDDFVAVTTWTNASALKLSAADFTGMYVGAESLALTHAGGVDFLKPDVLAPNSSPLAKITPDYNSSWMLSSLGAWAGGTAESSISNPDTLSDLSGNSRDILVNGTLARSAFSSGGVSGIGPFTAANYLSSTHASFDLDAAAFSLAGIFKVSAMSAPGTLVSFGEDSAGKLRELLLDATGAVVFDVNADTTPATTGTFDDGVVHSFHLTCSADGTLVKVYIDGNLLVTDTGLSFTAFTFSSIQFGLSLGGDQEFLGSMGLLSVSSETYSAEFVSTDSLEKLRIANSTLPVISTAVQDASYDFRKGTFSFLDTGSVVTEFSGLVQESSQSLIATIGVSEAVAVSSSGVSQAYAGADALRLSVNSHPLRLTVNSQAMKEEIARVVNAKELISSNITETQDFDDNIAKKLKLLDYGEVTNAIGSTGGGAQDIDWELGGNVTMTVDTSANTLTFSNWSPSGTLGGGRVAITNGGSQTFNWPAACKFSAALKNVAPVLSISGLDVLIISSDDQGTTILVDQAGLGYA